MAGQLGAWATFGEPFNRSLRMTFPPTTIMPRLPLLRRPPLLTQSPARFALLGPPSLTLPSPPCITALKALRFFSSPAATNSRPAPSSTRIRSFVTSSPSPTSRAFTSTPHRRKPPERVWPYLYKDYDAMPHLEPYFKQVDSLQDKFIERLREAVGIPSISSEDERRPDVVRASYKAVERDMAHKLILLRWASGSPHRSKPSVVPSSSAS